MHAMMDISDGIASDLLHILQMSGVGAEVSLDMIPTNTPIELAVAGGEDYKLLLTADVGAALGWPKIIRQSSVNRFMKSAGL